MEIRIFAIWDDKAKAYIPPFFMPQVGLAVRAFKDCVNQDGHAFAKHPADYTLFSVGTWDDNTGVLKPFGTLEMIARGHELVEAPKPAPQLDLLENQVI